MKKIFLLFITTVVLSSCGGNKKKEMEEIEITKINKFSIIMDAIYEKDDSIVIFNKIGENYLYDKPTSFKVKGSALIQRLTINIPEGVAANNFSIVTSHNKEQKYLTIKNISIKDNDLLVVDGDNYKYNDYFMADASFIWDPKLLRCNLVHTNKYEPGLVGNEKIEALLSK